MSVFDLLDWVDRRELKGQLAFERAGVTRKLQVAYGCVTQSSSNRPAEFLGQILLDAGAIDEETLRAALAARGENGMSLGKTLLARGAVTEDALRDALELKAQEGIHELLSWQEGSFAFEPDVDGKAGPRAASFEIALPLRDAMLSGVERANEWKALRAAIPGDEQRFWIPEPGAVAAIDPASPDARLLACVAKDMTVREIMLDRHSLPFPIYKRLAALLEAGTIRLDRRARPRAPGATVRADLEQLVAAARGRAAGGDRYGALALAKQALDLAPDDPRARKAYREVERALFAELSRALLSSYRVPRLAKRAEELRAIELTAEERYFVGRIDGRWDLLSLMRVAPLGEAESLITLERLAQRGVIAWDER